MNVWCHESDESIDPHVCAYDCEIKCFLKLEDVEKINQAKCGWSGCWRCEDCFYLLECEFYTEEEMEEIMKRKTMEFKINRVSPYHCDTVCEYMGCSNHLEAKCDNRDIDGTCAKYAEYRYPLPRIEDLDKNGKYPKKEKIQK